MMTQTQTTYTLIAGNRYDVDDMVERFTGWIGRSAVAGDGYNVRDYFDADGDYKGPDADGVEPTFDPQLLIAGAWIEVDPSGVGAGWRPADDDEGSDIRQEIAEQIIDAGRESCEDYVASNGIHYRWR